MYISSIWIYSTHTCKFWAKSIENGRCDRISRKLGENSLQRYDVDMTPTFFQELGLYEISQLFLRYLNCLWDISYINRDISISLWDIS